MELQYTGHISIMDPISTHLPVLRELLSNRNIKSVFEFGSGTHSTQLFADNCSNVITCDIIEDWYNTVTDTFKTYKNVHTVLHKNHKWGCKEPEAIKYLNKSNLNLI